MKRFRNLLFYVGIVGGCSALIYIILRVGGKLEHGKLKTLTYNNGSRWSDFLASIKDNLHQPLALLLAQIITILIMARILGWLCKLIGQPSVIGEVIAGILLGPSLVGTYLPEISAALFPVNSLANLNSVSQVGLVVFMFIIGMELDLSMLKNTRITERITFQARVEFFNALNHPTFGAANTTPGNTNFGRVTSQSNLPRQIQFGGRILF